MAVNVDDALTSSMDELTCTCGCQIDVSLLEEFTVRVGMS